MPSTPKQMEFLKLRTPQFSQRRLSVSSSRARRRVARTSPKDPKPLNPTMLSQRVVIIPTQRLRRMWIRRQRKLASPLKRSEILSSVTSAGKSVTSHQTARAKAKHQQASPQASPRKARIMATRSVQFSQPLSRQKQLTETTTKVSSCSVQRVQQVTIAIATTTSLRFVGTMVSFPVMMSLTPSPRI